ncbi:hypothetical protein B0H14DRAFT_2836092 [Mycena olivaceomarginata]|nr:hypothetical protein B0H14DRAFT_2836092 [Mycena olivaceomarginata]
MPSAASASKAKKPSLKANQAPKAKKAVATILAHPSWKAMIEECIASKSEAPTRMGVSRKVIKQFVGDLYNLKTPAGSKNCYYLNSAIAAGVADREFMQPKGPSGCIRLPSETEKEASSTFTKRVAAAPKKKTASTKFKAAPAALSNTRPADKLKPLQNPRRRQPA